MKQIINGMIYDEEKAISVLSATVRWWGSESFSTLWKVTLYLGNHGNWFFHNQRKEGIFITKWSEGSLSPATQKKAYEFLASNNEIELVEKYFPEKIENA